MGKYTMPYILTYHICSNSTTLFLIIFIMLDSTGYNEATTRLAAVENFLVTFKLWPCFSCIENIYLPLVTRHNYYKRQIFRTSGGVLPGYYFILLGKFCVMVHTSALNGFWISNNSQSNPKYSAET